MLLKELEQKGIITLGRGIIISKEDLKEDPGDYPVFSSSASENGVFGTYGKYMFDDERITWSIDGGGKLFYRKPHKYSVTNVCGWLKVNDSNLFLTKYIYYSLIHQWKYLEFNYVNKAHPSVIRELYNIKPINIKKQTAIVECLDKINNAIDNEYNLFPKYDELIKSRFIEMFGSIKDNKKGWKCIPLESGAIINKVKSIDTKKPLMITLDMIESNTSKLLFENYIHINSLPSSIIKFKKGCVLLSKLRPYLNKVIIAPYDGVGTSELLCFQMNGTFNNVFLSEAFKTKDFVDFADSTSYGAKMPRASVDMIKKYKMICPSTDLQKEFADFVKQIDKLRFVGHSRYFL